MLAPTTNNIFGHPIPQPAPEVEYDGFPFWSVLLAEPNKEARSAECLKRVNVHAYLPTFTKQIRCHVGNRFRARQVPVLPGMMFVPVDMLDVGNRAKIMDWAQVRFAKVARPLGRQEVEIIREVEAKLSIRFDKKSYNFKPGQRVRFICELYATFFGDGEVVEVASSGRISIKVDNKLIGGKRETWTTAAELEAM